MEKVYKLKKRDSLFGEAGYTISQRVYNILPAADKKKFEETMSMRSKKQGGIPVAINEDEAYPIDEEEDLYFDEDGTDDDDDYL